MGTYERLCGSTRPRARELMTARELNKSLKLKLTEEQLRVCDFLESKGLTFCVHFGYRNAVEKALEFADETPHN
jgi:hypothetical protein